MGWGAVIGAAIALAGTAVQMNAASRSRREMNKQVVSQLEKQKGFQKQATQVHEEALAGLEGQEGKMSAAASAANERYARANKTDSGSSLLPTDSARVDGRMQVAREAQSRVSGMTDVAFQNYLRQQEAARKQGVIGNLSSASAGTAPILTQLAGNKAADAAAIGSLMSSAGTLAGIYAGVNTGKQQVVNTPPGGNPPPGTGGHSNNQTVSLR
jgi:hypothetical protein